MLDYCDMLRNRATNNDLSLMAAGAGRVKLVGGGERRLNPAMQPANGWRAPVGDGRRRAEPRAVWGKLFG